MGVRKKKKQLIGPTDWEIIWESKTTLVQHSESLGVIRKIVKDSKLEEFIHEIFIGACIIPQMKYSDQYSELVYFDIKEKVSYWKFVEGISLAEYLKKPDLIVEVLMDILVQICGILEIGLEEFDFYNLKFFSKYCLIFFMIVGRIELLTILLLVKKFLFKS